MIKLIYGKFEEIPLSVIGEVDLIIADPPDNIGLKYDGFTDKVQDWRYDFNLRQWLYMMKKITNGPIFFTFNEKWTLEVENAIRTIDIQIIQRLQWYYTFGQDQTSKGKYGLCYRPIYWLNSDFIQPDKIKIPSARQQKYKDKRAASSGKIPPNVWEFPRICGTFKERRNWSPTQLPESMIERIVKGHCRPGGQVFDPFLGSGTTAIVCQRLGVDCIGTEISEQTIKKTAEHIGVEYCTEH